MRDMRTFLYRHYS